MRERGDNRPGRGRSLSVLMVEDSKDDAQLNVLALEGAGYELRWERVEEAEAMAAALARDRWDLVLCDHHLPRLDSLRLSTCCASSARTYRAWSSRGRLVRSPPPAWFARVPRIS